MSVPESGAPARDAIDQFSRDLADRGFAASTRRIRRHFLSEYLRHVEQAADTTRSRRGEGACIPL